MVELATWILSFLFIAAVAITALYLAIVALFAMCVSVANHWPRYDGPDLLECVDKFAQSHPILSLAILVLISNAVVAISIIIGGF